MKDHIPDGAMPPSSQEISGSGGSASGKPARTWDARGKKNLMIIGGIFVVATILMVLMFTSGGAKEIQKESVMPDRGAPNAAGIAGVEDVNAIRAAERARLEAVASSGQSGIEAPAAPLQPQPDPVIKQVSPTTTKIGYPEDRPDPQQQKAEIDKDKLKGLEDQMRGMMAAWGMGNSQLGAKDGERMYVRKASNEAATRTGNAGSQNALAAAAKAKGREVVPAFEQVYTAELMGTFDSDAPGIVRARILTGPLAGAHVIGTGQMAKDGVRMAYARATFQGKTFKVSAIGIDEETASDIVNGDYNGRYAQRFVFPVVMEGIKAYAGARAQTGTQVVAIGIPGAGGVAASSGTAVATPPPTSEQARNAMISASADQASKALSSAPQQPQVTLEMRKLFGLMFVEPVFEGDLAGTGS